MGKSDIQGQKIFQHYCYHSSMLKGTQPDGPWIKVCGPFHPFLGSLLPLKNIWSIVRSLWPFYLLFSRYIVQSEFHFEFQKACKIYGGCTVSSNVPFYRKYLHAKKWKDPMPNSCWWKCSAKEISYCMLVLSFSFQTSLHKFFYYKLFISNWWWTV